MRLVKGRRFRDAINHHPCFSNTHKGKFNVLHLPVAPVCNIKCRYCLPAYDCINESRPGISSMVLGKEEALHLVRTTVDINENLRVVAISGPGEPLANPETFEIMREVHHYFPHLILCLSTNGLLLPDRLEDIVRSGVRNVSLTMNAVIPEVAEHIYSAVYYRGGRYTGRAAADCLSFNQWRGLRNAIDAGLVVRINSLCIPGVNEDEIPYIAWLAGRRGADVQHIAPFFPQGDMEYIEVPTHKMIEGVRERSEKYMKQVACCTNRGFGHFRDDPGKDHPECLPVVEAQ